jgi:hypothetical protein
MFRDEDLALALRLGQAGVPVEFHLHPGAPHEFDFIAFNTTAAGWRDGLAFRYDPDDAWHIPVQFIGIWDTVGALGIPDNLSWPDPLDPASP